MLDRLKVAARIGAIVKSERTAQLRKQLELVIALYKQAALKEFSTVGRYPVAAPAMMASPQSFYSVLGVDGSQVYPDKTRFGGRVALINIGAILLGYSSDQGHAHFFSQPEVIDESLISDETLGSILTSEMIDLERGVRELEAAVLLAERSCSYQHIEKDSLLLLLDGSLLPHALRTKSDQVAKYFFDRWHKALQKIVDAGFTVASYVSSSASHDIVKALLEVSDSDASVQDLPTDEQILRSELSKNMTTPWFLHSKSFADQLAFNDETVVGFTYLNTGYEIARIEMMSKQIMSSVQRESVINRIVDQAAKGCGYPVALSEAHEQAVIRERDRRYFLTLLEHSFPDDGIGQKGQSKRIIPV